MPLVLEPAARFWEFWGLLGLSFGPNGNRFPKRSVIPTTGNPKQATGHLNPWTLKTIKLEKLLNQHDAQTRKQQRKLPSPQS
mmetsp:Transcript_25406/g.39851  ORF Transcript_25406/g.39851 Transcript_25406/m.39851 type:complete len:82 (-) Transcript_25406:489-734(-)